MIQDKRIEPLNEEPITQGRYVLYWMQSAQRAHFNHALEFAIINANQRNKPVVVVFGLTDNYPQANLRHYQFMLEGLKQTQQQLKERNIKLVILHEPPDQAVIKLADKADLTIVDEGYLKIQRQWRHNVAHTISCRMYQVTTNLIIPIRQATDKENYSAGTLRPRITKQLPQYLIPLAQTTPKHSSLSLRIKSFDISNTAKALSQLKIDTSIGPTPYFTGGADNAQIILNDFITNKLSLYNTKRNDPNLNIQSDMSPYLHFGQISPLEIALKIAQTTSPGKDAFLEELIVRRELSHNFVYYNTGYDQYETALPPWALRTLNYHATDKRSDLYSFDELDNAQTHDPYWNAAQKQMVITGKMHNYMRMYWGKKILEWTESPRSGFEIALRLNNTYELDGRDPNGYTGVAWCFGKHDRAWTERPIFGKIRYMNAAGLKRKFDADAYVDKISKLERTLG